MQTCNVPDRTPPFLTALCEIGLADPGPVATALWTDAELESGVCLDAIVTVVGSIVAAPSSLCPVKWVLFWERWERSPLNYEMLGSLASCCILLHVWVTGYQLPPSVLINGSPGGRGEY